MGLNPRRSHVPTYHGPFGGPAQPESAKPPDKPPRKPPVERTPDPPADPSGAASEPPSRRKRGPRKPPDPDRRAMVGTKLEASEVAKLDRIRARLGTVETTRSAALRWLVQTFDESALD